jgi:hypothetical protein
MRTRTRLALKVARGFACCALAACGGNGGSVPLASGSSSDNSGTGSGTSTSGSATGNASGTSSGTNGTAGAASGTATGASGVATGNSGATGASGVATGNSGSATGISGTATGASGAVTGNSGASGTASMSGAGAGDAGSGTGSGDASGPVVSGDGGTGCTGATFCDGFENSATLAADTDWKVDSDTPANVVEIVTNKSHSGSNSVHLGFTTTAAFSTYIDETKGFPNTGYWGRVWYFVMNGTESGHQVYIDGTDGTNLSNYGVRPLNTQSAGMIAVNVDPGVGGKGESGGTSGTKMPQGVWTCFEWQVTGVGGTGNVTLYMGGTLVAGTEAMGVPIPNLIEERIGYERYGGGAAGDIWMDDYAIGPTRIGCN